MEFDSELHSIFERAQGADTPAGLRDAMAYSLFSSGKRLRPRLVLAASEMVNLDSAAAVRLAAAIEMYHAFTLIHDDLPCMDNDDFRRGQPSCHKKFGEPLALLAGDALLTLSLQVFSEIAPLVSKDAYARASTRLFRAMGPSGVMGGQALEFLSLDDAGVAVIERIHALKTGALFDAACTVPLELVEASSADVRRVEDFSKEIGRSFQTADDLLDRSADGGDKASDRLNLAHRSDPILLENDARTRLELRTKEISERWKSKASSMTVIAQEISAYLRLWRQSPQFSGSRPGPVGSA